MKNQYYYRKKNELYEEALNISYTLSETRLSWGELADILADLEFRARKYGLLRELRENGIL